MLRGIARNRHSFAIPPGVPATPDTCVRRLLDQTNMLPGAFL